MKIAIAKIMKVPKKIVRQFSYNWLTISSHTAFLLFRTIRILDRFMYMHGRGPDKLYNLTPSGTSLVQNVNHS